MSHISYYLKSTYLSHTNTCLNIWPKLEYVILSFGKFTPFKFVIGVFQNVIEMQKSLFRFVTVRWLELWKKSIQLSYFRVALLLLLAAAGQRKSLHLAKWSFVSHVITRLWQKGRQYFVVTFWGAGGQQK